MREWDASPGVKVVAHCTGLEEAKRLMWSKEIYGILDIPADYARDIRRGDQAHVGLYCDMGALLNYKTLLQAASDVSLLVGKRIQVQSLPYASRIRQEISASPVRVEEVKMFNPAGGFASFIIPASATTTFVGYLQFLALPAQSARQIVICILSPPLSLP